MIKEINGKTLVNMFISGAHNLINNRQKVDEMNVFPVPDGDTGTNMSMTMKACIQNLNESGNKTISDVMKAVANDTLRGARGNSGVILSQLMRGMRKAFDGSDICDTQLLAKGFKSASDYAYRAVMKPTEGTILTVAREMSEYAVKNSADYEDVADFFRNIKDAGITALNKTPEMLPKLKQAGVVDSGGQGLMCLIEGMYHYISTGTIVELVEIEEESTSSAVETEEEITFAYCTECIVDKYKKNKSAYKFKAAIEPIGDSMVFVDDDDLVKVHIHTNTPDVVIAEALKVGDLSSVKIENMRIQHSNIINAAKKESNSVSVQPPVKYAFVSVAVGEGIRNTLTGLGVDRIIEGGQTMNPSTDDIIKSLNGINAENIFVFPNNKNIIMAAEQAKSLSESNVIVVPTTSVNQAMSCMVVFDEELTPDENLASFSEVIENISCGQITNAVRDTSVDGIEITEGDYLVIVDGKIKASDKTLKDAVMDAVSHMVDEDTGVITLFYGIDTDKSDAEEIKSILEDKYDECDVFLYDGGQSVYHYLISAE